MQIFLLLLYQNFIWLETPLQQFWNFLEHSQLTIALDSVFSIIKGGRLESSNSLKEILLNIFF